MRIGACQLVLSLCAASATHAEATLLDAGYRHMYNLRFSEAHDIFAEWERQHPEDPMGPASDAAAYLFTEFDRLHILQSEFFVNDEHFYTDRTLTPWIKPPRWPPSRPSSLTRGSPRCCATGSNPIISP
jgi:hypothetical protein